MKLGIGGGKCPYLSILIFEFNDIPVELPDKQCHMNEISRYYIALERGTFLDSCYRLSECQYIEQSLLKIQDKCLGLQEKPFWVTNFKVAVFASILARNWESQLKGIGLTSVTIFITLAMSEVRQTGSQLCEVGIRGVKVISSIYK